VDDIRKRIESKLKERIEEYGKNVYPKLLDAMKYSLLAGGKRLRPLIVYNTGIELGISEEILINLGIAVEMIHTASLIHDDLPAIDDDDYRRGKPSCHRIFGEGMALVAGDGLILLSMKVLNDLEIEESTKLKLEMKLLESAGVNGMIGGEAEDIDMTGKYEKPDLERVLKMYERKTGALFSFSFSSPIICIGDEELENRMDEIGRKFGVAFQIYDDLKDLIGTFEEIGKTPRKDEVMDKPTVPRLVGVEKAREIANGIYEEAVELLKETGKFGKLVGFLRRVKEEIERR